GALIGCGDHGEPEGIQQRVILQPFASCEELENYIEDTAVRDMKLSIDAAKDGGWFLPLGDAPNPQAADTSPSSGASGPSAYTKTNVQVAGVDEADFMKNDGTRIFMLSGQQLYTVKSWPADQMAVAGKLTIEGYPTQMYLDDKNRVVVFSGVYTKYDGFTDGSGTGGGVACLDCYYYSNTTKVTVVDVRDLARPTVAQQYYLPGYYANSRRVNSSIRIVMSDSFRWPSKVKFYPDYNPDLYKDKALMNAALESLKADNERVI